jgi:broad specificity phosphatase PhoE
MGELVLVRHAQASAGTADYDRLSPLGFEQARWLGEYLALHGPRFDRVVRGALRRHRETAEGLAALIGGPGIEVDPRLDELHYSPLEREYLLATGVDMPTSRAGFLEVFPRIFLAWERGEIGTGGESYAQFEARIAASLQALAVPGRSILAVTSGGVIGVTLRRVLGLSAEATADLLLNIHNASVHRLTYEGGRLRLSLFNASPHLDPVERAHARTYI